MSDFGVWSYGLAAGAYLVLLALLLTRWRRHVHGSWLLPATFMGCVWSATLTLQAHSGVVPLTVVFITEIVRDAFWLLVLLRVLNGLHTAGLPGWLDRSVYAAIGIVLLAGLGLGVLHDLGYEVDSAGAVLIPGAFLLTLTGVVLVEQVYRNTRTSQKWSIKFLWLGAGAMLAYDFCLYSMAILVRQIPYAMWDARGAANALLVPLIAVGIARTLQWAPTKFMSRRPALYTTSIVAAGLYLLAMAVAGYYVRIIGGSWGGAAQILFLFGAGVLLVIVLFSGQARAWFRVFLLKHFASYKYDYRAEWLRLTRTLSSAEPGLPERVVHSLAQIVSTEGGGLWVAREDGKFIPAGGDLAGPDSPIVPGDSSLLRFMAEREWIVNVEARRHGGPGDRPEVPVPDWLLGLQRAWLVVPLLQEQQLVAFVVVARSSVPQHLTWEDLDLLRTVARQAASYIALEEAARRLVQSQQFEAYNRFAAFMMHDLKNLIAQQTLVVQNAARHRDNPEFIDDAISTIESSVKRMNRLLEQLRRGETVSSARRVNVVEVCAETVHRCIDRRPSPAFASSSEVVEVCVSPERLAMVLEHVIRNAQDATAPEGEVRVEVRRNAQQACISVADTGRGMDAAFIRERLFRPFDTTKGSQGMGIGAFQTREFVRQSGGDVQVESEVGRGTRFLIHLPLAAAL